jgi:hypothetical protein
MNPLNGYGYTAALPPGFNAVPLDAFGGCYILPPGSTPPPFSMALIWLSPIFPAAFPMLLQTYFNFDNPMVALSNAYGLGLSNILQILPLRQSQMNGAQAYIREFDALSISGQPKRMTAILLQGPASAVQVIIGIDLYQWAQFGQSTFQFVAGIQLTGTAPASGTVRAVMNHAQSANVELQVVDAKNCVTPVMTVPAQDEQGRKIVHNFYGPVHFGNDFSKATFSGDNLIGDHNSQNNRGNQ